jgi:hypothetical protein
MPLRRFSTRAAPAKVAKGVYSTAMQQLINIQCFAPRCAWEFAQDSVWFGDLTRPE